jgi:hypothetical protein
MIASGKIKAMATSQKPDIFTNAEDLTNNQIGYANAVKVSINQVEVVVKLYLINPANDDSTQARHISTFIMPIRVAENLGAMLSREKLHLTESDDSDESESDE